MRLGTFNVWGLPEAFSDDVSSRMRALVARLEATDLDILLIQEAWTREVRRTLRHGARRAGFAVSEGDGASGGLMTLSRLPIRSSRFERFRFRGDPERLDKGEYLGGKGFEVVEIEGEGGPFAVVNTHTHARYRIENSTLDSAVRTAQLLQIVAFAHDHAGSLVIGGDFNCRESDPEYRVFRGLTGAIELGAGESLETLSSSNFYKRRRTAPDKRIDFLFVRPARGVAFTSADPSLLFAETARIRRRDRSLSDHYGFRADLHWRTASLSAPPVVNAAIDPQAVATARALLEVGMEEADRRERQHFRWSGGFLLAALAAAGLGRHPAVDRRAFLRGTVRGAAVLAVVPAVGFGALARVDSDHKRDAFADARALLRELEAKRPGSRVV
ncbi:MAG: endonuclease/exonuclease/phosphatase family protein [Myxococcota bacterium]